MEEEKQEEIEKIKADLGENYQNDEEVLQEIIKEVSSIAFDISHNKKKEKLYPYIKKAVKAMYLARGAEGLQNKSEGSISNSYEDIVEKLRNDIIKNGLRRIQ